MEFNSLLDAAKFDPTNVLILRHRPIEPGVRKVLPWLANERHDIFNAYQQTQTPRVEKAMLRAAYVASFIGCAPGKAVFVGLYKRGKSKGLTRKQFWRVPAYVELKKFGMLGMTGARKTTLWFDLAVLDFRAEWKGKLIVAWPGIERSWCRWAANNQLRIVSILEDSLFDREMPHWTQIALSWADLAVIPTKWREALRQWRGIYFILDVNDGQGYVGAAYGDENLLGRWQNYAKSGHGGNRRLRTRKPQDLRFSILQRVSPDMEPQEVQALEATWKDRLHTRTFGLNDN